MSAEATLTALTWKSAQLDFGIDLDRVTNVEDSDLPNATHDSARAPTDVAAILGLPSSDSERRRVVDVATPQGSHRLLVGADLRVRTIARDGLRPLPQLVAALHELAGLDHLLVEEGRIIFLLDPDRIAALTGAP